MNTKQINEAKALLEQNGYHVSNLWHTDDVHSLFDCSEDEAQEVLHSALTNDNTMEQIRFAIRQSAEANNLKYH